MNNFKKFREKQNLTQAQVAQKLACTPQAYQRYETGAREADYKTLIQLSIIFNASIDELLGVKKKNYPIFKLPDLIKLACGARTIEAFANDCGIDVEELKKISNKETDIKVSDLQRICAHSAHDIALEQLITAAGISTNEWTAELVKNSSNASKTVSSKEQDYLTIVNRAEEILGEDLIEMFFNVLDIVVEKKIKEKNKKHDNSN